MARWVVEIEFGPGKQEVEKVLLRMLMGWDGFTNLYSSITAEPRIMLSMIRDRNIEMTIKATSAIIPRIEEINSNFLHPSALLMNHFNFALGIFGIGFRFSMLPPPLQL